MKYKLIVGNRKIYWTGGFIKWNIYYIIYICFVDDMIIHHMRLQGPNWCLDEPGLSLCLRNSFRTLTVLFLEI